MFKDLKKGYQVYTLDTSGVPKFFMGTVAPSRSLGSPSPS